MERCLWCHERVQRLHPVPPEVVTRALVAEAGGAEKAKGLEGCAECITTLMEGNSTT